VDGSASRTCDSLGVNDPVPNCLHPTLRKTAKDGAPGHMLWLRVFAPAESPFQTPTRLRPSNLAE
jgi:hypothetical protein